MGWNAQELPLAKWLIDKTNTSTYRQGKLKGSKHPKVDSELLKIVGGRAELVRQAKILENIPEIGGKEYLYFHWIDRLADIEYIKYRVDVIPRLCKLIGITDARERQERAIKRVQQLKSFVSVNDLEAYCKVALEQLEKGNTKELSKIEDEDFFRCLEEMSRLEEPEWKRVFSARVFKTKRGVTPSKVFERIYQGMVIEVLRYSPRYEEGMSDDEILAVHGILTYSQTLEWKGNISYCLKNENDEMIESEIDTAGNCYGTVLNAQTLKHAVPISINGIEKIIVIENKANYESMKYDPQVLYIFCHGFFSPKEVAFLRELMNIAPQGVQCYHWGDMDYGGIQIFLYNEKNIFPELLSWKMDVDSYREALKKGNGIALSDAKRKKLEAMNAGKLEELKLCILENGVEIEQEMQL